MPALKSIMVKTHRDAVVKVAGDGGVVEIDLDNDLIPMGGINPGPGVISVTSGDSGVTVQPGVCTPSWVGAQLFTHDGVLIGTISAYNSSSSVTMSSPAALNYNNKYNVAFKAQTIEASSREVNILGVAWTGAPSGVISISRGGVVVMTLQADQPGYLTFDAQSMCVESTNNTSNIEVTLSNAQCEVWIKLRKASGYATNVETAQFGIYDDVSSPGR